MIRKAELIALDSLTDEEFDTLMRKAVQSYVNGLCIKAEDFETEEDEDFLS